MKIERFNMQGLVTDNARWVELVPNPEGSLCFYDQVPELEAKCAELEAKCAELERQLGGYVDAFDCIFEAMGFAQRAIADPDSIAVVDLPTESKNSQADIDLIAAAPELLEALESLVANVYSCACTMPTKEEREAWDKADAAIAKAKGGQP